ncbi:MAG TPA: hypothetical protein VFH31_12780 [Pyrinomonadaceae bacterium]|nr:hypothetical protein [Pyrinomonadaceae bacterium]
MNVNLARVFLGGLVAGVVLNIGEVLFNTVLFAEQMDEVFRRLNVPPPGGSFIAVAVILTFALGILIVWLYALIRPRCGPGPKTAICAALIVWFCACVYCGILYGLLLRIPTNLIVIGIAWCLVEYSLAAIAGAWLYRENGRPDIAA